MREQVTVNGMVDFLRQFSVEVTRVAVATGTHGDLGQRAKVAGVSGEWRNLTDSVNMMSTRITDQVRRLAQSRRFPTLLYPLLIEVTEFYSIAIVTVSPLLNPVQRRLIHELTRRLALPRLLSLAVTSVER